MERYWTEERLNFLREHVQGTSRKDLWELYKKDVDPNVSLKKVINACDKYHISNGIDTKFKHGTSGYNKGKKMEDFLPPEAINKLKACQFKPQSGRHPGETFTKLVHGKPHRFIKVGYQKNEEVVYARYLYEQTYGVKLKPSDMIIHLDGDSLNDDLDNLMLVDVKDHLNIIGAPGIKYTEDKDINKAIVLATKLQRVAKEKSE